MGDNERLLAARLSLDTAWERLRNARSGFTLDGREHRYFVHGYNQTWRNERAVEVPVARTLLGGRVLEVGNVLGHYGITGHAVVDKYEQAAGVLNVDALDFRPDERFDAIVSISTVEHMGFDEPRREVDKPRRAVAHLASLLAPGGTLLVTIPLGYNPDADLLCAPGAGGFDAVSYLLRTGSGVRWRQAGWPEVEAARYGAPYPAANAVAFGVARA